MPYQIISVDMPPSDDQHPFDCHGIKLALRPIDNAPVVVSSDSSDIVDLDVLVSVNGTNLDNVEGGIPCIEEIFTQCQKSEMKIVIHRVDEVPPSTPIQCNVIDQNTSSQCQSKIHTGPNQFRVCSKHNPLKLCSFVDPNTKIKCTNIAKRGGFCDRHHPIKKICPFVDPNTKIKCTNPSNNAGGLCKTHAKKCCSFVDPNTKIKCTKVAQRGGLCFDHHPDSKCSFVDPNTKIKCTKVAICDGLCRGHDPNYKCTFVFDEDTMMTCPNIAKRGGFCDRHHPDFKCTFVFDEDTMMTCPNIALSRYGLCFHHGGNDRNQCKNGVDNKRCIRNRCINSQFCAICTPGNKCQVDGCDNDLSFGGCCDEHSDRCSQTFIFEYMEQKMDDLKDILSKEEYEIVKAIHDIRKILKDNPFQDDYDIDKEILKIVDKLMGEFHSENKYKDQQVKDTKNNYHPLLKHVHTRLVWIIKAAIRDWRDDFYCDLPIQLMKQIADQVFEFFKSLMMSCRGGGEISSLVFKIGSGDAVTRPFCPITYPSTVFHRDLRTDLGLELLPNQRWQGERFAIKFGLGFIKCSNINLPGSMIPYTDACKKASLYMVASRSSHLVRHVGEYALDRHGAHMPSGYKMVPISQSSSSNSGDATEIASTHIVGSNTASSASTTNNMPSTTDGEAATSSSPHHNSPPSVNRESTLVGLDDKMMKNVASFLPEPSQILFSMVVGRELQSVLTNQHDEEGCTVDFGTDNDLAVIIHDGDLKQLLHHAENSVGVKALILTQCIHITGEGLEPLRGSENIEHIDLRVIADNDGREGDDFKLSCCVVVPILHSIVDTTNNSLRDFYFPSNWYTISSESFHRLLEQYHKMKAAYNCGGDGGDDYDDEYYDIDFDTGVGFGTVGKDVSRKRKHSSDAQDGFLRVKTFDLQQKLAEKEFKNRVKAVAMAAHRSNPEKSTLEKIIRDENTFNFVCESKLQGSERVADRMSQEAYDEIKSLHTPSTSSEEMVTRVRKHARAMALGEDTTPNTKKLSTKVYRGILNGDGAVRQAIFDCEEDEDSEHMVAAVGKLLFGDER